MYVVGEMHRKYIFDDYIKRLGLIKLLFLIEVKVYMSMKENLLYGFFIVEIHFIITYFRKLQYNIYTVLNVYF